MAEPLVPILAIAVLFSPISPPIEMTVDQPDRKSTYLAADDRDHSDMRLALGLIDSAVKLAETCEPVSQGFLLLIAADAVRPVDRQESALYYLKSFEVSRDLPRSSARLGLQRALVVRMVSLNLDRAADLLERMDPPDIAPNPTLDARANLATTIVAGLLNRNSPGDPEKAVALLMHLGDTGQYPYPAAEQIIHFFHRQGEDWRGTDVLSEALSYFRNDGRFDSSTDQFVALLRASQGQVNSAFLVRAARAVIALAGGGEESGAGEEPQPMQNNASARELLLQRRLSDIIGQLLAIVEHLDPSAKEELKERYTRLQQSIKEPTSKDRNSEGSTGAGTAATANEPPAEVTLDQRAITVLGEVQELAEREPAEALTRAQEIPLPAYRSRALAMVARGLAKQDPRTAESLLGEAETLITGPDSASAGTLEDLSKVTGSKVEALAGIAEGWALLGNSDKAWNLLGTGLNIVTAFLEKQAVARSRAPSGLDSSVVWLDLLARQETDLNPKLAVERSQAISQTHLRAYVLLSIAREALRRSGVKLN